MDFWQWFTLVGGIIGFVALLMATQPFTQAIWGNPRIEIEFQEQLNDNGEKLLFLDVSNKPIYDGILKKLAVYRRTAEGFCIDFFVYDSFGKRQLIEQPRAEFVMSGTTYRQVSLPASITWASVELAKTYPNGKSSILTTPNTTSIEVGLYRLYVVVSYEGHLVRRQRVFTIGNKPDGTYWVNS